MNFFSFNQNRRNNRRKENVKALKKQQAQLLLDEFGDNITAVPLNLERILGMKFMPSGPKYINRNHFNSDLETEAGDNSNYFVSLRQKYLKRKNVIKQSAKALKKQQAELLLNEFGENITAVPLNLERIIGMKFLPSRPQKHNFNLDLERVGLENSTGTQLVSRPRPLGYADIDDFI